MNTQTQGPTIFLIEKYQGNKYNQPYTEDNKHHEIKFVWLKDRNEYTIK